MSSKTRIQTQTAWTRIQTFICYTLLPLVILNMLTSILFPAFLCSILETVEQRVWRLKQRETREEGQGATTWGARHPPLQHPAGRAGVDRHKFRASRRDLHPGLAPRGRRSTSSESHTAQTHWNRPPGRKTSLSSHFAGTHQHIFSGLEKTSQAVKFNHITEASTLLRPRQRCSAPPFPTQPIPT